MKRTLLILSFFISIASIAQTKKIAPDVRNNSADTYPLGYDSLYQGGLKVLHDTTERNTMLTNTPLTFKNGSMVFTYADSSMWRLDSAQNPIWIRVWQGRTLCVLGFTNIQGNPGDNSALAAALAAKQNNLPMQSQLNIFSNYLTGYLTLARLDSAIWLWTQIRSYDSTNAGFLTYGDTTSIFNCHAGVYANFDAFPLISGMWRYNGSTGGTRPPSTTTGILLNFVAEDIKESVSGEGNLVQVVFDFTHGQMYLRFYNSPTFGSWTNVTAGSGSVAWGFITGTLSSQTDLATALNGKLSLTGGALTGNSAFIQFPKQTPAITYPVDNSLQIGTANNGNFYVADSNGSGSSAQIYTRYVTGNKVDTIPNANGTFTLTNGSGKFIGLNSDALNVGSTNLYFTNALARASVSVAKAPLSYNSSTGVFDIDTTFSHSLNYLNTVFATNSFTLGQRIMSDPVTGVLTTQAEVLHSPVKYATAAALPANTYNNGTSGVGATITGNSNGALSVDGVAVSVGDRILVKNEATAANNGIYNVTATGSAGAPYILTRGGYSSIAANMAAGSHVFVQLGNTNAGATFFQTTTGIITFGTTNLIYNNNPQGFLTSYTETDPIVKAINGIVKSNGITISAAVSGTDYAPATSGSALLKGNGSGGFSSAVVSTDYLASSSYIVRETPSGSINGSNVTFTLANTPISGKEMVFLNGVLMDSADDYTISSATITFATAPPTGAKLRVTYLK